MKKTLKNAVAFALALSLALGIGAVPSEAKSIKGAVAPLTPNEGGVAEREFTNYNPPAIFSKDYAFDTYKVSGDIYIPLSMFSKDGGHVFITPMVNFWFPEVAENGLLECGFEIVVGWDYEQNRPYYEGLEKGTDKKIPEFEWVNNIQTIDDMVKLEIVDAPLKPELIHAEYGEDGRPAWTEEIPSNGDVSPQFKVGTDYYVNTKFVLTNAAVKFGDKEYRTDYSGPDLIGGYHDGEYHEVAASTINTTALSVAKTSVKIKKKKKTTVKVTTMFSGDKVTVSSSAAKVAKATYKSGKVTIKGLKKGKATISVKANGKTKKIKVTVKK